MTQIVVTLENGADTTLLRRMIENMKGVMGTSIEKSTTHSSSSKSEEWLEKVHSIKKQHWLLTDRYGWLTDKLSDVEMKKIFLDTNFIIDYFIREDSNGDAERLLAFGKDSMKFHISYLTIANFAY